MKQRMFAAAPFALGVSLLLLGLLLAAATPQKNPSTHASTRPVPRRIAKSTRSLPPAPVKLHKSIAAPPASIQGVKAQLLSYSGGLRSYFEPCGCQADMLGGMARLSTLMDGYRNLGLTLFKVDTGNLFFEKLKVSKTQKKQNELKANLLAETFKRLGYQVMGVGPHDLLRGTAFFAKMNGISGVKAVSSNLVSQKGSKLPWSSTLVRQLHGHKVGFLSLTAAPLVRKGQPSLPSGYWQKRGLRLLKPMVAAKAAVASLKKAGAKRIILLSTLGLDRLQAVLEKVKGVDIAIDGHEGVGLAEPRRVNGTLVFSIPKEGQKLGVIALYERKAGATWDGIQTPTQVQAQIKALKSQLLANLRQARLMTKQGPAFAVVAKVYIKQAANQQKQIAALKAVIKTLPRLPKKGNGLLHMLVGLSSKLPDNTTVRARISRYEKDAKKANLDALAKIKPIPLTRDGNFYAGVNKCRMCHQPAYAFWKKHRHAKAWATLVNKNKQFDLDCVGCHVVGWQKPGGLWKLKKPDRLVNVQCESCHKHGGLHARTADKKRIKRMVAEATCRQCHQGSHDPNFNYRQKLKLILGKGHGEKRLKQLIAEDKK